MMRGSLFMLLQTNISKKNILLCRMYLLLIYMFDENFQPKSIFVIEW